MISFQIDQQKLQELRKYLSEERYTNVVGRAISGASIEVRNSVVMATPVDTSYLKQGRGTVQKESKLSRRITNYREYGPIVNERQDFVNKGIRKRQTQIKEAFMRQLSRLEGLNS